MIVAFQATNPGSNPGRCTPEGNPVFRNPFFVLCPDLSAFIPASFCFTPASFCFIPASFCFIPASFCFTPASFCFHSLFFLFSFPLLFVFIPFSFLFPAVFPAVCRLFCHPTVFIENILTSDVYESVRTDLKPEKQTETDGSELKS